MNAQQSFATQFAPATSQHDLSLNYEYPPPQLPASNPSHQAPPYQYHPQGPVQQVQQQQRQQHPPIPRNLPPGIQDFRAPSSLQDQSAWLSHNTRSWRDSAAESSTNALPVEAHAAGPAPGTGGQAQGEESEHSANEPADANGPVFNIPPPPEGTYASEAELEAAMHGWSREHGYELVRRASKKNARHQVYKRYYHCSKHGRNHNQPTAVDESKRRANRKSQRSGCPMSLAVVALDPSDPTREWQIRHRKTWHNHAPTDALKLAGHRRRERMGAVESAVDGLFAIGTDTPQVLQFLQKTNPNGLFTRTDVANMKMKWKKFGTCADRILRGDNNPSSTAKKRRPGPSACLTCRQKHDACGSERPVCNNCQRTGRQCQYDHEPREVQEDPLDPGTTSHIDITAPANSQPPANRSASNAPLPPEQAERILANLRSFRDENVQPIRLTLQSSSVEVLAQSSCGNGTSFNSLPALASERDWPAFRDAMVEAAMRENTYDVLTGKKAEPQKPDGADDDIEVWNEYIKQLAIYQRRNSLLLSAFGRKLGPGFKYRVQHIQNAAELWNQLEEHCAPRGSEQAYRLYSDLHNITLANSTDLKHYIARLESTYSQFKKLKINTSLSAFQSYRQDRDKDRECEKEKTGADAVSEEMLCFLFLRGLGPEWARWVEGLVATNNIGGFGTGERLGWVECWKRAVGYEAMQRRELGPPGR